MLFTCDEEVGSLTSRQLIEERATACGRVLVLEPSADGGALKIGRKGVGMYYVEISGRAAHAGLEPEKGINALVEAAHQVLAITAIARPRRAPPSLRPWPAPALRRTWSPRRQPSAST